MLNAMKANRINHLRFITGWGWGLNIHSGLQNSNKRVVKDFLYFFNYSHFVVLFS